MLTLIGQCIKKVKRCHTTISSGCVTISGNNSELCGRCRQTCSSSYRITTFMERLSNTKDFVLNSVTIICNTILPLLQLYFTHFSRDQGIHQFFTFILQTYQQCFQGMHKSRVCKTWEFCFPPREFSTPSRYKESLGPRGFSCFFSLYRGLMDQFTKVF